MKGNKRESVAGVNGVPAGELRRRLARFREELRKAAVDVAYLSLEPSVFYLSGVRTDNGVLVVPQRGRVVLLTDFRYVAAAERVLPAWVDLELLELSAEGRRRQVELLLRRARCVGFEGEMVASRFVLVCDAVGRERLRDVSYCMAAARCVKSAYELERIRRAAAVTDAVFAEVVEAGCLELSEREIAQRVRMGMLARGGDEAFATIAAWGANAAECHHVSDGSRARGKGCLLVDMGAKVDDYCSDMTRCVVYGKPSDRFRRVYDVVLKAQRAALKRVRPGVACAAVDRTARRIIEAAGYGDKFGHSLGHGVGLVIHEAPVLGGASSGVLEPGMVVTVEPGVYLPGVCGVRIEDLVVVTEDGCEVLSQSPKELTVL